MISISRAKHPVPGTAERVTLAVEGMSCGHCAAAVRAALSDLDGVAVEQVTVGSATVRYDAARTDPGAIAAAVAGAGYPARPVTAP